ncbi:MAG: hypothetical protein ABSG93_16065 [Solirubrobacteraceae bacterium]|jgi:hypothetical protein
MLLARATHQSPGTTRVASPGEPAQATEPVSSWQTNLRQTAAEVAQRFPPMTAEQAAAVRRALRKQRR